ncbi:AI-2E family transporter [Bacillus infantis]|uniref:AI-2E family transporter n=1 Tax=Bacillus infantis TaxID=324767 RepID=UPI003CFADA0E
MWIKKPFFMYITGAILVLTVIFLLGKIDWFIWPFRKLVATIFFPILISGLLYYILRPVIRWLGGYIPKTASILVVFATLIGAGTGIFYYGGSLIAEQITQISDSFPDKMEDLSSETKEMVDKNDFGFLSYEEIEQKVLSYSQSFFNTVGSDLTGIISAITSIATVLVVVPFILFYFSKDDEKLRPKLLKWIPDEHKIEGNRILLDIDKTLSTYIIGQFIIAFADGVLMYIGYLIIGLDYALVLALFAMFLTVVPFLGPLLGVIPAIFVGLMQDPFMVVKILIVLAAVQQLEGNLITPQVMGKRLNIHPLTVILLLLVAGSLYGFIGILVAIPFYSVVKVIVRDFWKFYRLRHITGSIGKKNH